MNPDYTEDGSSERPAVLEAPAPRASLRAKGLLLGVRTRHHNETLRVAVRDRRPRKSLGESVSPT